MDLKNLRKKGVWTYKLGKHKKKKKKSRFVIDVTKNNAEYIVVKYINSHISKVIHFDHY